MMNERIKELELEAAYDTINPNEPFTAGEFNQFTKKFAELIVQEVIYDCMNSVRGENVIRVSMVAKHWGVEVWET